MLYFLWNIATFVFAISILITVHECGHFFVARHYGVKIVRFSIGFGRIMWRWHSKDGTEYVISAIPLGGYVKMLDEQVDTILPEQRHAMFNQKTIWKRALIIVSGPLFNVLFSIFAYWLIFMIGMPIYKPIIGDIIPYSIVEQAKFSPGMEIKSIDDIETPDWDSVRSQLINKIGSNNIHVGITYLGSTHYEKKVVDLRTWKYRVNQNDPIVALGIIPLGVHIEPILGEIKPGSVAMKAGLQVDDKIIKVDNHSVSTWQVFLTKIRENPDRILKININRQGRLMDIWLKPDSKVVHREKIEGFAGVIPKIFSVQEQYKIVKKFTPFKALCHAIEKVWRLISFTISMLGQLLIGDIKLNHLSGLLSMAQSSRISAEYGWIYYLMFLAIISVNVGITNLFPLPLLDGGHLFFLIIEKLKGKPLSERVQNYSYRIGSIILIFLIGITIFNDLSRLR
ncbi:sigma E protease regulator RseP [Candidatus Curculioniphilus buchneri]|uniref:sigma E protease regulator RseP n=1 Tax=Candidatus Curculioniphilus buchneri TaxID=690594 RepID=UPI00376F23F0